MRPNSIRLCLVGLVCLHLSYGDAASTRSALKETEYGIGIKTGSSIIQYHDTCVWVQVFFASGDFFRKLRQRNTPDGPQFIKDGTPISKFPDSMTIDVEATVYKCSAKGIEILPPDYASGLLNGASFDVRWMNETETRPARVLSTNERHKPGLRWDYFIDISTQDIPLVDDVLIEISLRGGISRTSLHAGLISPKERPRSLK